MSEIEKNTLVSNSYLTKKIFRKYLMPSVFALMASNLSHMIDVVIIGNFLGDSGLAAMSLVAPVSLVFLTTGSLVAVGSSIMAGIAMGEDNKKKAESFLVHAFLFAALLGAVLSIFGNVFLDSIVSFLGAKGELTPLVRSYCQIYISGGVITVLFYSPFNFLKLIGKPNKSMLLLITMCVVNIVLTLLFVTKFSMGTSGAALATIISLGCSFLLGCRYMLAKDAALKFKYSRLSKKDILGIFTSGSASASSNLSRAIVVMLINMVITQVGTTAMLTIYTVSRSINELFLTFVIGISQSIVSLVSLFYGEKDNESIERVMKISLRTGTIVVAGCGLAVIIFAKPLIALYGVHDIERFGMAGIVSVVCVGLSLNFCLVNMIFSNYFSAIKSPLVSSVILLLRTLLLAGCAYALGSLFGTEAIWGFYILAEIIAFVIWFLWANCIYRKKKNRTKIWLLPKENQNPEKMFSFSVKNTKEDVMFASRKVTEFCEERNLSTKEQMMISLAIEELLLVIIQKCWEEEKEDYIDLRIIISEDETVMRIRNAGTHFNPLQYFKEQTDELSDAMGIGIIMKAAKRVEYKDVLGMNNLMIVV